MHPPLDRPHPDCQMAIASLRNCQKTRPIWKAWACNDLKFQLDHCFRKEKERMLVELNKDLGARRAEEEAQAAISTGTNMTFEEYLKKDKKYQKEMENIAKAKTTTGH